MNKSEKKQARCLSEYVDGIIAHTRAEEIGPCDNDPSLGELARLASNLSQMRFVIPDTLHENVLRNVLREADTEETTKVRALLRAFTRLKWNPRNLRLPVGLACAIAIVSTIAFWFSKVIPVSAATVLARSETALANLVGPNEILHRRWSVRIETTCPSADDPAVRTGRLDEWLETTGQVRSAGRSSRSNGNIRWEYTTGGPENRHLVYFPPSSSNPRGLVSVEPTTQEYYAAMQHFPLGRQPVLKAYLDRGYLVEPIVSDQRFNWRAIQEQTDHISQLPRVVLSIERASQQSGDAYYRVGIVEERRPWFWWSAAGEPLVWLEHQETVRFISANNYLSWRIESKREDDQGCRLNSTRKLIMDERLPKTGSGSDVFALQVPPGTPVRRQSATELLRAVLAALDRTAGLGRHSIE